MDPPRSRWSRSLPSLRRRCGQRFGRWKLGFKAGVQCLPPQRHKHKRWLCSGQGVSCAKFGLDLFQEIQRSLADSAIGGRRSTGVEIDYVPHAGEVGGGLRRRPGCKPNQNQAGQRRASVSAIVARDQNTFPSQQ